MYCSVILPLALEGTFTYRLPDEAVGRVVPGLRVVVQFGARRYYTGIVYSVSDAPPKEWTGGLKTISDLPDETPIVRPEQLALWEWIASYYMCSLGEVMKAALPSGLKLESETLLEVKSDFEESPDLPLTPLERQMIVHLKSSKEGKQNLLLLEKQLNRRGLMAHLRRLVEMGAVSVKEGLKQTFHPRRVQYVKLSQELADDEPRLHIVLDGLRRAPARYRLLLRFLELTEECPSERAVPRALLCKAEDGSAVAALIALRRSGILLTEERTVSRLDEKNDTAVPESVHFLSESQQRAFDEINLSFRDKPVCLLHGVTSSGKTEVYIRLIQEEIARGRQVLYLVPEIALTTQLTERLRRVFGDSMGVYHSRFSDSRRVEIWQRQLSSNPYDLILGARSSLFLPIERLGLIIVDEEHETSYKQQDPAPRYQARDVAVWMGRQRGAHVLLGSATPAVESYRNALSDKYGLVSLTHRFGGVPLPEIIVEDLSELSRKKLLKTPFSPRLIAEVEHAVSGGAQAILFQNRRGYAPSLICRQCGWTPTCGKCDVPLTYHQNPGNLVCHYCGTCYELPRECPACGEKDLRDRGCGTQKVEEVAEKVFEKAKILRMDLDTTRTVSAYEDIIGDFRDRHANLLIGTQMVTKGLDFSHVRVVGILDADQQLNSPDFRAVERSFQMLTQVAGRAGRRDGRGLVILQTRKPQSLVIDQIVRSDYRSMYEMTVAERETFRFPPFCRLIEVYLRHRDDAVVDHAAAHYAALLRPHLGDDLLGPDRPLVSRIRLLYIRKLIIKIPPDRSPSAVRALLRAALERLHQHNIYKGVQIHYDVDP